MVLIHNIEWSTLQKEIKSNTKRNLKLNFCKQTCFMADTSQPTPNSQILCIVV